MRHEITPTLAKNDPEKYKAAVVEHMAQTTELGALAWNNSIDNGTVNRDRFTLDTDVWHSRSNGLGHLTLGTLPMDSDEKSRLLYRGETMRYPEEVSHRLLHELGHGAIWAGRNKPKMDTLRNLAVDLRRPSGGEQGLTPLGSLPSYGDYRLKADEDTAELLAQAMTSKEKLHSYLDFLRNPRFQEVRNSHSLITVSDHDAAEWIKSAVHDAVIEFIDS